nr:PREDICTED: skin secretory protein xP2-like [Nicotiana tabacum]
MNVQIELLRKQLAEVEIVAPAPVEIVAPPPVEVVAPAPVAVEVVVPAPFQSGVRRRFLVEDVAEPAGAAAPAGAGSDSDSMSVASPPDDKTGDPDYRP